MSEPQVDLPTGMAAAIPGALGVTPLAGTVEQAPTRRLGILGWLCAGWMVLIVGAALLAPLLPLPDPQQSHGEFARMGPGHDAAHILGGDATGKDMLSRVIFGARTSLLVAGGAVLFGLVIGGVLGLLAGYFKGRVDTVLSTIFNVFLAMPALVLALSLVTVLASTDEDTSHLRKVVVLTLVIGVVSVPILARITRASTLSWSERDFVKAAEVSGATPSRIIIREVLPNVLPAMMSIALLGVAVAIVAEGSLALLGVGISQTDAPTWGNMIVEGRNALEDDLAYIMLIPAAAIFFTVLSLNYLGDVVRARFDVRESVL
jgi:peptide/nickel transport system permease protein